MMEGTAQCGVWTGCSPMRQSFLHLSLVVATSYMWLLGEGKVGDMSEDLHF